MNALVILAVAVALLIGPILSVGGAARKGCRIMWFPPTFLVDEHHANATNYAFHIVIKRGIGLPGAILCQERAEWGFKWKRLYLPVRLIRSLRRDMELFGQAVEIEVAAQHYGADVAALERSTAISLTHYQQFRGWSAERILPELVKRRESARRWAGRHKIYVRKAIEATA